MLLIKWGLGVRVEAPCGFLRGVECCHENLVPAFNPMSEFWVRKDEELVFAHALNNELANA
jgi:hypothetical protein